MRLLQLLSTLGQEELDFIIFGAKLGGKRLFSGGKIFLVSIKADLALSQEMYL
jgi:hypothetical protein